MKLKTFFIVTFFTLFLTTYAHPWFVFNEIETAFCEECTPDGIQAQSVLPMGQVVVYGADSFLESYSSLLSLLRQVETSNVKNLDNNQFLQTLDNSIQNMENAISFYGELKQIAAVTPYRNAVVRKLQHFDYAGFEEQAGLNPQIFARVKAFLGTGNIRGSFTAMYEDTRNILDGLNNLKNSIDPDTLVSQLWNLNQMYANTSLFGQYIAQVIIQSR